MMLSIIIPVYNVEPFVEKCILSTQLQDIPISDYEVIVINDGSKDNSLQIVNRMAMEYSNIAVISKDNGGLSSARNVGIFHAKGEYIMFLDSDDWIADNCLGKLTSKLKLERPDCLGICAANVMGNEYVRRFSYIDEIPKKGYDHLSRGGSPCAPFSIWSREFLQKYNLNFLEGIFHEDSEFTPRAYYLAEKMSFTNDIIYYVYQNPNSITRTVNPKKSFDMIEYVSESLYNFCKVVDQNHRYIFYDLIGVAINEAMDKIRQCSKEKQNELNKAIVSRSYLYDCLKKSGTKKYHIEAMLFKMFPKYPLTIYKVIQFIARK